MNNILKLCDVEFDRMKKGYFLSLLIMLGLNIFLFFSGIKNLVVELSGVYTNNIDFKILKNVSIEELQNNAYVFRRLFEYMAISLGFFVILALIFCVFIWYRDCKDKTILTLFSLPQNRMNIFISKFLVCINMIFGYIIFSLISVFFYIYLIKIITNINLLEMFPLTDFSMLIRFNYADFFVIDILGVITAVSLIFATTLYSLYNKKIGKVISPIIIIASLSIFVFIYLESVGREFEIIPVELNINALWVHIIYLLLITILSFIASNKFINEIDL